MRVGALIARLGVVTQKEVSTAGGAWCGYWCRYLTKWLSGIDTHQPAVVEAGVAAMQWQHAQNKDQANQANRRGLSS